MNKEDGGIYIKTEIDSKDAIKNLDNLTKKIKDYAKGGATVAAVTTAMKKTAQAVKECSDAFNVQAKAEKQLTQAARNNPYLNNDSVKQLEKFASSLQSISTVGDEEILPLMSQLASAGRTQEEIQNILTAALDVSASGMMDLSSAVTQLNATYSGNVGLLGRQISELKDLTSEQLKSGQAIEIIGKKFAGMAKETASATGSAQQLKNAWGDLKEEFGASFERALAPMRKYFTELLSNIASAKKALRDEKEYGEGIVGGTVAADAQTILDYQKQVTDIQAQKNKLESQLRTNFQGMGYSSEEIKKELEQDSEYVKLTKDLANARQVLADKTNELDAAEKARQQAEKDASSKAETDRINAEISARDKLRDAYDETIRKAQEEINQRRKLGEEIDEQTEAQTLLDTAMTAYVEMMSDPAFAGNNGTYEHEVDARKQIAEWAEKAKVEIKEIQEIDKMNFDDVDAFLKNFESENPIDEQIQATIDALEREQRQWKDNADVTAQINDRIVQLEELKNKALDDLRNEEKQKSKDDLTTMMKNINSYFSEFSDITSTVGDLVLDASSDEATKQTNELNTQYEQGLISYQEYCDKKTAITKKQSLEEYKVKMWEWSASLAQATANIAQGVSAALSQTPPMSFIQAALVSAAGAAQIATLTANKPQRPAFEQGGIVGGSFTGATSGRDDVVASLHTSEMVLNANQQKQLWMMANGKAGNGNTNVSMPVTIENNNGSNVSTSLDSNGLRIIVDNMVSTSMKQGKYTNSMNVASSKEKGVRYL